MKNPGGGGAPFPCLLTGPRLSRSSPPLRPPRPVLPYTIPSPFSTVQTNPTKYRSIAGGFGTIVREQGAAGLFRGWLPTLLGYSAQGAFKFGLYEYFKK